MITEILSTIEDDDQRNELAEFYEQNKGKLYSIAFSRLHNRQDAEDAVQETFLRIAHKPEKFFSLSDNKRVSFADVIIRNVSIDMFNKNLKIPSEELTEDISDNDLPIDEKIIGELSKQELIDFVLSLSDLQKSVLIMYSLHRMRISEIAAQLNVSENVVRQRLYQARKAIREFRNEENKYE